MVEGPPRKPTVSFVVETYNLGEGTDRDRFVVALHAATAAAAECDSALLVVDICGSKAGIGGFIRYAGKGVVSALMSVMDFGFLYPVRERTRQGYDTVGACWANPRVPGAGAGGGPAAARCLRHDPGLHGRQGRPRLGRRGLRRVTGLRALRRDREDPRRRRVAAREARGPVPAPDGAGVLIKGCVTRADGRSRPRRPQ